MYVGRSARTTEVGEGFFDALNQRHVTAARAVGEPAKIFAGLIRLQEEEEFAGRRRHLARHGLVVLAMKSGVPGSPRNGGPPFQAYQYVRRLPSASRLVMLLSPRSLIRMGGHPGF